MLIPVRVLALAEHFSFEILKGNHDDSDVVERLPVEAVLQHALDGQATLLMDRLGRPEARIRLPLVLVARFPDALGHVLVGHLVEDAIAGKNDEIVILVDLELSNLWLCLHDVHVASAVCKLGLRVSEGARDR